MNCLPYHLLAPVLANTSCSIAFAILPELARQPIEEVHDKATSVARFFSCPTCRGTGVLLYREGMENIRRAACPTCHGAGTAESAAWELIAQNVTLERTIAAMVDNQTKLLQKLKHIADLNDQDRLKAVESLLRDTVGVHLPPRDEDEPARES